MTKNSQKEPGYFWTLFPKGTRLLLDTFSKRNPVTFGQIWFFCVFLSCTQVNLPEKIAQGHGGKEAFYNLRDVSYDLEQTNLQTGQVLLCKESYVFDQEKSKGTCTLKKLNSKVQIAWVEYFDGKTIQVENKQKSKLPLWVSESALYRRKRNYFLFALPFKLLDQGVNTKKTSPGKLEVQFNHETPIEITYSPNEYEILSLVPKSIQQSSWTCHGFLSVLYQTINGIKLPKQRMGPHCIESLTQVVFWNGH